jgi:hypothetical protein
MLTLTYHRHVRPTCKRVKIQSLGSKEKGNN